MKTTNSVDQSAGRFYTGLLALNKKRLGLGVGLSLLQSFLLLPVPVLVGVAIDRAIPAKSTSQLAGIGLAIVLLTVVSAATSVAASSVIARISADAGAHLRNRSLERLMKLSRKEYSTSNPGSTHDQVVHEAERVDEMSNAILSQFVPGTVLILGLAAVLASLNLGITFVTFVFAPVIFLTSRLLGRRVMKRVDEYHGAFEDFSRRILSVLRSMDLIRIQGAEDQEVASGAKVVDRLRLATATHAVSVTIYFVTQQALVATVGSAVLIFGGISVIRDSMTLGDLITFYAAFAMLRGPLGSLAQEAPTVIEGLQSLDKMHGLLATGEERPYRGKRQIEFDGSVSVRGVSFGYSDTPVIQDIDLHLEPGKLVGIIGPNGAGKSTLVNLVLGFYRPDAGEVTASGVGYDDIDISHLRQSMGVVPQQPLLQSGSVRANIEYGNPPLSDAALREVIQAVGAEVFVDDLANGVDTPVGEDGAFLSGGQRQRLAIARAIAGKPPLLVLDEPTNHLDRDSVSLVVKGIRTAVPGAAILVVSHRDEVLEGVDELYELHKGSLATVKV